MNEIKHELMIAKGRFEGYFVTISGILAGFVEVKPSRLSILLTKIIE